MKIIMCLAILTGFVGCVNLKGYSLTFCVKWSTLWPHFTGREAMFQRIVTGVTVVRNCLFLVTAWYVPKGLVLVEVFGCGRKFIELRLLLTPIKDLFTTEDDQLVLRRLSPYIGGESPVVGQVAQLKWNVLKFQGALGDDLYQLEVKLRDFAGLSLGVVLIKPTNEEIVWNNVREHDDPGGQLYGGPDNGAS